LKCMIEMRVLRHMGTCIETHGKENMLLRSFWVWFAWLAAAWSAFLLNAEEEMVQRGMLGCAFFFALYFVLPLFRHLPAAFFAVMCGALLAAAATFYGVGLSVGDGAETLYALLIFSYLAGEAVYRLPLRWAVSYGMVAAGAFMTITFLKGGNMTAMLPFAALYVFAIAVAMAVYRHEREENGESGARYEALLDEYRKLKRHVKANEEAARTEERTNIARQIHDSVGHSLTALLMQLEMFRLKTKGELQSQAEQMKRLAQGCLEETRKAVKSNEQEKGGIPAIIRLIRNLEAESYVQVEFSLGHGASRRIAIRLESPGGRIFRFEVTNDTVGRGEQSVREGFGLTAMRERVEKAGEKLEITHAGGIFNVRGTFNLEQGKG